MHPYENWKVRLESNGTRHYHYGTEEEITKELDEELEYSGYATRTYSYRFVPQDEWTAEDWVRVCEYELENANRHSFVNLPYNFLASLLNNEYAPSMCAEIMRLFAMDLWDAL